jgi:NodT family efflux transporter outer membrane factor (OMF) lipoprotein
VKARASLLCGALLVAGCAAPGGPPAGRMLEAAEIGLAGPAAPRAAPGWWRAWGDPGLDRLMEQALARNPRLVEALARVDAARAAAAAARGDALPRASLDGGGQYQRFSNRSIYPPPFGGGHYWMGSVQGNLSWDLDFWGRQKALIAQAAAGEAAAALDAAAARLALTGALAETYVALHRAHALLDVAERAVAQRERLLGLVRRRVAAGIDSRIEEKQAEGQLALARVARQQAAADREVTVHALAALSGEGAAAYAGIGRPALSPETVLPLPAGLPADLLARRPDVLAARARVEAALSGTAAARAAFYPNVNLAAFAGWQAIGLSHLLSPSARVYGAGPAIHLPLFDARLGPNLDGATAEAELAVAAYNGAVLGAVQQVADRLTAIGSLDAELADQRRALEAAEEAFALAERRYGGGLATYLAVLSAETQLLEARRQRAALEAQQAIERIRLLVAVGGDFEPPARQATRTASRPSVTGE